MSHNIFQVDLKGLSMSGRERGQAGRGIARRPSTPAPLLRLAPPSALPHVVSVFGKCLFGVVLIVSACVFGLCRPGSERAPCRADGVPSAPCGSAVPSTLLSHRERRDDRLLQGEHHFPSHIHTHRACSLRGCILDPHPPIRLPFPPLLPLLRELFLLQLNVKVHFNILRF